MFSISKIRAGVFLLIFANFSCNYQPFVASQLNPHTYTPGVKLPIRVDQYPQVIFPLQDQYPEVKFQIRVDQVEFEKRRANRRNMYVNPADYLSLPYPSILQIQNKCLLSNFYKTIKNSIGSHQNLICDLNAIEGRKGIDGREGINEIEGCSGTECPTEIRWIRLAGCENNGMIRSRGRFRISGPTLEIDQLENHDAGLWGCVANRHQKLIGYKIFQIILNSQNFWLNCANSVTENIQKCSKGQICEAKESHRPKSEQSSTNTYRGCTNVTEESMKALLAPNECIAFDPNVPQGFTEIRCFCAYDRCNLRSMDKFNLRWDAGNSQQAQACAELMSEFSKDSDNGETNKNRPFLFLTWSISVLILILINS